MSAEKKLKDMEITLPTPPQPIANYVRAVLVGNFLFISGHGPYNDGKIKMTGKIGRELTVEEGYQVARNVGLNCLATVKAAIGSLRQGHAGGEAARICPLHRGFQDRPQLIGINVDGKGEYNPALLEIM